MGETRGNGGKWGKTGGNGGKWGKTGGNGGEMGGNGVMWGHRIRHLFDQVPKKVQSKRKCSLDAAFVGHGGGGGRLGCTPASASVRIAGLECTPGSAAQGGYPSD